MKINHYKKVSKIIVTKISILIILLFFQSLFFSNAKTYRQDIFRDKFSKQVIKTKIVTQPYLNDYKIDEIIYFRKNKTIYKRVYEYLTPEMFGAKGDGKTDDYIAIQKMLDAGEAGCIFKFSKNKTYYNAFKNNGKWIPLKERNMWIRNKPAVFQFNGAKLTRRKPEWNNKNIKDNYNTGDYYTDDHTALLYLTGNDYIIDNANFNSGIKPGYLLNENEKQTDNKDYAVGTCLDMGLWLDNCKNVKITNSQFSSSVFPILMLNSSNIELDNVTIKYAAQASKRIHSKDLALGGGIKLEHCENINLKGITGYRNLNNTVEIESFNKTVYVTGNSNYDYSNSLVIIDSENININWKAKNITSGSGVLIRSSMSSIPTKDITGKIEIDNASWAGVMIWLTENSTYDIDNLNLNISTRNTGLTGLLINNESKSGKKPINFYLYHDSYFDGLATGNARIINNTAEGTIAGDTRRSLIGAKLSAHLSLKNLILDYKINDGVLKKYEYEK